MHFYTIRRGFSLVELIIAVGIICAVIAAFVMIRIHETKERKRKEALPPTYYLQSFDYSTETTDGSRSWIPINHGFWEAAMPNEILNLLHDFEEKMGVIITGW